MDVIFLRHGTVAGNLERRFIGVTDQPLTPQGEALARRTAGRVPPVERVYVSPLTRCRQTAQLVWPDVPETVVQGLRETDFGPFEGKSHQELRDDPVYNRWLADGGKTFHLEGTETAGHCYRRIVGAVSYLLRDAEKRGLRTVAVVSHGGILMSLLEKHGRPRRSYYDWLLPNCGGYRGQVSTKPLRIQVVEELGGKSGEEDP